MTSEHERAVYFLLRFVRDKGRDVPMSQEAQRHIDAVNAAKPPAADSSLAIDSWIASVVAPPKPATKALPVTIPAWPVEPTFLYENAPKPAETPKSKPLAAR